MKESNALELLLDFMQRNNNEPKNKDICNLEDLFQMLDSLFISSPKDFWNEVYFKRDKDLTFLTEYPDENLLSYFEKKILKPGKVFEIGCGQGRNATYFSEQGCEVDAIDISLEAIKWAKEIAKEKDLNINFFCRSIFDKQNTISEYDIVYDSGCLHHIYPHRRLQYIEIVKSLVKQGGYFSLVCFAPGYRKSIEINDWDVYRIGMTGGLAFTKEKLIRLFEDSFDLVEFRKMSECDSQTKKYGKNFLWATLWRKK